MVYTSLARIDAATRLAAVNNWGDVELFWQKTRNYVSEKLAESGPAGAEVYYDVGKRSYKLKVADDGEMWQYRIDDSSNYARRVVVLAPVTGIAVLQELSSRATPPKSGM